ncbi:hypothetical protein LRP31_26170 [Mesorhizobium mediterraneum]|uniref:Lectin n=1 Tax=Mesorhizobium mediterraneum TaxID=43617 RepID=A0AB36RH25_9HYPH|nr:MULTISPECIES: hypothetical protein [Mesorhizobium]RUU48021.1 hypothetical protein EOD08_04245 [Mesorhizobium sp. M6A.T.Ca.TU.002.02.2.1]PAQ03607.1 hypothetical protein CIT25_03505 [Mesorhizobium mediterraneum]RUU28079.1 hypothetical protein EOC94_18945 [Mesorhizobium sp. M6A.T.Ce.TU.016.01.1.1]RVB72811.1 hypothetical protein EN885_28410 [Mesorhizobium sp. M6A.T.Cr.TU.014.01.1.1]RWN26229.1 MAG: hypothetical protein EOR95_26940 [Mesorhizobium sp.]
MRRLLLVTAAASLAAVGVASSQDTTMSFFVTSVGSGKGADLGGLAGADAHCGSLAEAAGVTGKTWRAYLSTSDTDARDRIGKGPWFNAKGDKIADDVASLHSDANAITKQTALDEKGNVVNGRGDKPNRHDVLTGSKPDGTKIADQTCGDWTLSGAEGAAMTGHHDRAGLDDSAAAKSWNSSHASRGGCSQEALKSTGGDGLFYCFAAN